AVGLIPIVFGAIILSTLGAGPVVVVGWLVLTLTVTTINSIGVIRSQKHDGPPTTVALLPTTEPMQSDSGVRYRPSRRLVGTVVAGAAFVTGGGTLGFLVSTVIRSSPPPIWFPAVFILISSVIWYGLLTLFAVDIAVSVSDGRVVFHCLAK